jgi:hypothetical protein
MEVPSGSAPLRRSSDRSLCEVLTANRPDAVSRSHAEVLARPISRRMPRTGRLRHRSHRRNAARVFELDAIVSGSRAGLPLPTSFTAFELGRDEDER